MFTEIFHVRAVNGEHLGYVRKRFNLKNLCDLRGGKYGL